MALPLMSMVELRGIEPLRHQYCYQCALPVELQPRKLFILYPARVNLLDSPFMIMVGGAGFEPATSTV